MTNPTVYLAGPVQHTDDGGKEWRDYVIEHYDYRFDFNNPIAFFNAAKEDDSIDESEISISEIVANDKNLIRQSDAMLIGYESIERAGTAMETMFAYGLAMPVVLWIRGSTPKREIPIWYRYHTDEIRHNLGGAIRCIDRLVD